MCRRSIEENERQDGCTEQSSEDGEVDCDMGSGVDALSVYAGCSQLGSVPEKGNAELCVRIC